MSSSLAEAIRDRSATVGIVGLGYVGLPLLRAFCDAGFSSIGYDVDPVKIDSLHQGKNYLRHLGSDFVREMKESGRMDATDDFGRLREADAVLVCVPTPLGKHQEPDLSFVESTTEAIARTLRPGQLIVLESTTYPSTTRGVMLPILESSGQIHGSDFFLAYSPEREDPGRKDYETQTIPKLVGGIDEKSGELAAALYRSAIREVVLVSSAEVAEAAKLLENIYRSVNIALVNELKRILSAMSVDIWEVVDAAATKPFGFQPFYPGPGLGGHCIPIDPFYLAWKAREIGLPTRFIELAGQVNHAMPDYVVSNVASALNKRSKAVRGARILILGVAYKPDVDDVRESPAFELIEKLIALGAVIEYNDPWVSATHRTRRHDFQLESVELTPATIAQYDCVVIATHHSVYDWKMIADHANLIVDTRGVMRTVVDPKADVVQA